MFSRVSRRNTEVSQASVAPYVQDDCSLTDTQQSGCKKQNKTVDAGDQQPANKYQRFELESDNPANSWLLHPRQVTYVHKFLATHI